MRVVSLLPEAAPYHVVPVNMELFPSSEVFASLVSGDAEKLWEFPRDKLKPFLPFLCKAVFDSQEESTDSSVSSTPTTQWKHVKALHSLLCEMREVNKIKKYLELDFIELKSDAVKERQLIAKRGPDSSSGESSLVDDLTSPNLAIEFEKGSEEKQFRLVLSEILNLISKVESPFQVERSDLFKCEVIFNDIAYILCIAVNELSSLIPLIEVTESLLRIQNGSRLVCCLVANLPHCYNKVVTSLIMNGESLDEISLAGRLRSQMLRDLVMLQPTQASYVQWLAYTHQKLPTLMIFIALDHGSTHDEGRAAGVLSLMSDIVIHGDKSKRIWFGHYMKLMQQKYRRHKISAVTALRKYLMKRLVYFMNHSSNKTTPPEVESMEVEMGVDSNEAVGGEEGEGTECEEEEEEGMDTATLELVDQMEIEIEEREKKQKEDEKPLKQTRRHCSSSFSIEHVDFPPITLANQMTDDTIIELTQLLHVCCGLKIQVHMYLTNEESSALLHLITCTCPPFSSAGVKFIEVSLSLLLACPFLINSKEAEIREVCKEAVVSWLNWILTNLPQFEKAIPGERCYGEMLLLIVIHLQEKQLKQIEKLISSVLGMKTVGPLGSGHFTTLKELFLKVFKENVVCSHAVSVPPTQSLNDNMAGYLPIHCVHQLMRSKAFRKHGVHVKDWIYRQLLCTSEPLHSILPSLIEEFVMAILVAPISSNFNAKTTAGSYIVQVPFTADEVLDVFRCGEGTPTDHSYSVSSQILMLYYVLYYQDTYLNHLKSLLMSASNNAGATAKSYSPNILLQLPVKRLLQYASLHQEVYQTLYPSLVRLIVTHFPHLCLPEDWITQDMLHYQSAVNMRPLMKLQPEKVTIQMATTVLQELRLKPSKAFLVLCYFDSLAAPSSLVPFCSVFTSTFSLLLEENVSKRVQQLYSSLWMKLNSVIPRRLWVETVNSLRPRDQRTHPPHAHQNLVEDPLIVLRCDQRVYRCPPVFEILLRILAAYTSASRVWLSEHAHTLNCSTAAMPETTSSHQLNSQEREELRIALTAAQESSIIQLLLEICLPTKSDKQEADILGSQLTSLREIQCQICCYLHQVFISEPSMVKLIHFQGYPLQLLPMMVAGVPSMHIVMDFMSELLSQPQIEKQVFGIQLLAHVTYQYPLSESVGFIQDILRRIRLITEEIPPDKQQSIFVPILPALVMFCQSFPPVTAGVADVLLHLCRVCLVTQSSTKRNILPIDINSLNKLQLMGPDTAAKNGSREKISDPSSVRYLDPVFGMEETLEMLRGCDLVDGVGWAYREITETVLLKVSGKT